VGRWYICTREKVRQVLLFDGIGLDPSVLLQSGLKREAPISSAKPAFFRQQGFNLGMRGMR